MLRESRAAAAEYDTAYAGNLPAHDTTGRLDEWFEDNFTYPAQPRSRARAGRPREHRTDRRVWFSGTPRLPNTAELLGDEHDSFLVDWRPIQSGRAKAKALRMGDGGGDGGDGGDGGSGGDGGDEKRRRGACEMSALEPAQRCQQEVELPQKKCWARSLHAS